MTTAKGLTSGFTCRWARCSCASMSGATIADGAGAAAVGHGQTCSAHPVSAAVGLAALDLYGNGLSPTARAMGARLQAGLATLADHPLVGDVRGRGDAGRDRVVTDKAEETPFPAAADALPPRLRPGVGERPRHPRLRQWRSRLRAAALLLHRGQDRRHRRAPA